MNVPYAPTVFGVVLLYNTIKTAGMLFVMAARCCYLYHRQVVTDIGSSHYCVMHPIPDMTYHGACCYGVQLLYAAV